jgi:hypothetical protein
LNEFLCKIFATDSNLNTLLDGLGLSQDQIRLIEEHCLEDVTIEYIEVIRQLLLSRHDGVRQQRIIFRRYGLDGRSTATLQQLGDEYGVTRERIRQLQNKATKRCGATTNQRILQTSLYNIAIISILRISKDSLPESIASKLSLLTEIRSNTNIAKSDYENEFEAIIKQAQLDQGKLTRKYASTVRALWKQTSGLNQALKKELETLTRYPTISNVE